MTVTLAAVAAALDALYPPALAEPWDAVGLVCGDPDAPVSKVLLAVDPVQDVVEEALATHCQLLVTHHPLYRHGTTSVAADDPKGKVVHALVRGGCGLFVAHTNAERRRAASTMRLLPCSTCRRRRHSNPSRSSSTSWWCSSPLSMPTGCGWPSQLPAQAPSATMTRARGR